MSNIFGLQILGVNNINQQFDQLTIRLQKDITKKAFRKASRPIISESRRNLKASQASNSSKRHFYDITGNTSKSLGLKVFKSGLGIIIGAKVTGGYKGYLAHIIDNGTTTRRTSRGSNRGKINASNFFTSTLQQQQGNIISDVNRIIQSEFR